MLLDYRSYVLTSALHFKLIVALRKMTTGEKRVSEGLEELLARPAGKVAELDVHLERHADALVWLQRQPSSDLGDFVWLPEIDDVEYTVPKTGKGQNNFWPYSSGARGAKIIVVHSSSVKLVEEGTGKQVRTDSPASAARLAAKNSTVAQVASYVYMQQAYKAAAKRRKKAGRLSTREGGQSGEKTMRLILNDKAVSQEYIAGMKGSSGDPAWYEYGFCAIFHVSRRILSMNRRRQVGRVGKDAPRYRVRVPCPRLAPLSVPWRCVPSAALGCSSDFACAPFCSFRRVVCGTGLVALRAKPPRVGLPCKRSTTGRRIHPGARSRSLSMVTAKSLRK